MKQTTVCIGSDTCVLYLSVACYCSCSRAKCVADYDRLYVCAQFPKGDLFDIFNLSDFVEVKDM